MPLELSDFTPFLTWLPLALLTWVGVVLCVVVLVAVAAWLVAAMRHGPVAATQRTSRLLWNLIADIVGISPRRVWALTRLAIQESIRKRVVVVFGVFILLLLFAGWFLDPGSTNPARLYLSFVLTATSYLVLLLALILSSLSLPVDIKNRTLHMVVTKPVRASEVVLGRILGFVAVGTLLLAVMGTISYAFVVRGLSHTHELTTDDLQPVEGAAPGQTAALEGHTTLVNNHRHSVIVNPSTQQGRVEMEQGHTHKLVVGKDGKYELGPAEGMLLARVPIYGKLMFQDASGQPKERGVSVGDEWTYRSYIAGGTPAAAVWTFHGVTEEAFPTGLPVELNIGIFRTFKGNIEKGVAGSLSVRNPKTGKKVEVRVFETKEYVIDVQQIPRELQTPDGKKVDLFKDIVDDGTVEVWLQCAEPQQYLGAGQADMYLRARDASFALNFAKGYVGIWLQMSVVIALGVMFSTFLSGPIAVLATLGTLFGGFCGDFMFRLATGKTYGGGPFESLLRMVTQMSITGDMEPGAATTVAQSLDQVVEKFLHAMSMVLPDFGKFSFADYVASGFNVSGDTLLTSTCRALAFVLPVFVAGYLCLRTREVGK
jgi:ABC-type transport system involved in multi-copper enzyme maturation permease subunit